MKIKALSLWQPWASLVIAGEKKVETRGWYPGKLDLPAVIAIHATKGVGEDGEDVYVAQCLAPHYRDALKRAGYSSVEQIPRGFVLGLVRVVAFVNTAFLLSGDSFPGILTEKELAFGDYSPGRYGWIIDRVLRYEEPEPATGRQNLWEYQVPRCREAWVRQTVGLFDFVK